VAYRRRLIGNNSPRHLAALTLRQKSGYGKPLPEGRAWGVAVHESSSRWGLVVKPLSRMGIPRCTK
jgi:isoquinoline 1-oxidoreductase beta subunit